MELMNKKVTRFPADDCKVSSVAGYSGGPTVGKFKAII